MSPDEKVVINHATDAIVHVDVTTAFMPAHVWAGVSLPAGGLPVPGGDEIVSVVLRNTAFFTTDNRYATVDSHPRGHISWATSYVGLKPYDNLTLETALGWMTTGGNRRENYIRAPGLSLHDVISYLRRTPEQQQTLWPEHGEEGTEEAELHPALRDLGFRLVLVKGYDLRCDSYSAVQDNICRSTGFAEQLRANGVRRVFVDGLAYTHCVGWTALDLVCEGFEVCVIRNATRSVPIPGLEDEMTRTLTSWGVWLIDSSQLAAG